MRPSEFRGVFRDDEMARAVYSESAGVARIMPRAVAVPVDPDDVVALVRWASHWHVSLVARGSASSMANGAVGEGVIVDLSRLDTIRAPDAGDLTIRCGPGAIRDSVHAAAAGAGLAFPVDPASGAFCTVGGMCSTNAAGTRAVKHGSMRRWVRGVEFVFADGSRSWVRRGAPPPSHIPAVRRFLDDVAPRLAAASPALSHWGVRKESSGYGLADFAASGDLVDVLVGSEGTLGLIVDLELRLAPALAATASVLAAFDDLERAAATATACAALGASAVELLDRTFLDFVRTTANLAVPAASEAVLIVEAQGSSDVLARMEMAKLAGLCRSSGATCIDEATDAASEKALWAIRHSASPIVARLDPNLASMQIIEDGAVPPESFPAYVRGIREISARHRLRCVIFGHAGDAHAHVNALADVREPDWRSRAEAVLDEVTTLVAVLGGTVAAEHGDGRLRAPLLPRVWKPLAIELFEATKRAFDPDGILNPGVKVALSRQQPLGDVKYDPMLPQLPVAARAALDEVARNRGWARHRLALLDG